MSIDIADDGSFVATSTRLQSSRQGRLSDEDVAETRRLLAELYPFSPDLRGSECRDCFTYEIRLDLGGSSREIALDEGMLPNSGFGSLVAHLNSVLTRELPDG
jgi:hypothetical protein